MLPVDKQRYIPYIPLDCPVSGKQILVHLSTLVNLADERAILWPCGNCDSWHVVTEPSKYAWIIETTIKN